MANSVLMALSDTDSRLFATNFWNTQGISNDKKDQQRDVLNVLENARSDYHASQQAKPIRYCYVAWSIIKLDDHILFFQREDTQKRFDCTAGDYGLVGGRVNQNDIPLADKNAVLKALQSPDSELIKPYLPITLQRELREETGLVFDTHYSVKPWRTLQPYRQVQGSAPNHALTEYYLDISLIELTLEGYLYLQKIKDDEHLVWFSIDEMVNGKTADGKIPYIQALYDDFAGNREKLKDELVKLSGSFTSGYCFNPKKYGVTLPINHESSVLAGVLGKEQSLDLSLTARQLEVLLGLAAHLRGFDLSGIDGHVILHPFGWLEVHEDTDLQAELITLAALINQTKLVMESHLDKYFRLSADPKVVVFDTSLFTFIVKQEDLNATQSKIPVLIHRDSFNTAIGKVEEKTEEFKLTLESVHNFKSFYEQEFSTDNETAINKADAYKKGLHKMPKFLALGLRDLICREDGVFKFRIAFKTP